jgi:hypothetical protein
MFLTEALTQQGCSSAQAERAQTLWQEFLATAGTTGLSGSAESWYAALHYLIALWSGRTLTQKEVGALYHTAASTLSNRVKLIKANTDQAALAASFPPPPAKKRRRLSARTRSWPTQEMAEEVLATAQKLARPVAPPALDDPGWIAIFRDTHRLLSHLYGDKTHIEILHYLNHVQLNLALAGYPVAHQLIRDQFGKLFHRLSLQPAKGRDPQKFIYLQDGFGTQEPFVLLKLGDKDG